MNSKRFERIENLFTEAFEMNKSNRRTYLQNACKGDTELFHEVVALLENFESACLYFDHFEV